MIMEEYGNINMDAYAGFSKEFLEKSYKVFEYDMNTQLKEKA